MIPPLIVQQALDLGIDVIAITDHNASANVAAVQKAAEGTPLVVLPGMELQTREEVHLLCLFETLEQLNAWQAEVDRRLPDLANRPEFFGEQFVVDETGDFLRREHRLLITSARISLSEAVARVHELDGLCIPAHIDRRAFSLIANLGLIPQDIPFDALEVSRHTTPAELTAQYPESRRFPLIMSGDVHRLDEFLGATTMIAAAPTFPELRLALKGDAARSLRIPSGTNGVQP